MDIPRRQILFNLIITNIMLSCWCLTNLERESGQNYLPPPPMFRAFVESSPEPRSADDIVCNIEPD